MGGLDLFSAKGNRDNWSFVENLKYPFNSPKDDFSISWNEDGNSGYLASNRDGGKGADDLYSFSYAPPTRLVMVVKTLQRLEDGSIAPMNDANVRVEESQGALVYDRMVNQDGLIYSEASCNTDYVIEGQREGYFASSTRMGTPPCLTRHDTVYAELIFDKLVINKPIVLENIYYDFDKWNIRPDAAVELDKLVKILVDNPTISIELGSHTDSRGTAQYNETLSQKRAEAAVEYIISRGIDASRITAKGYGENVPVNECVYGAKCTDEQFQMNRRTEFKILRIN
jgi:outer membrane protein OmpA-like peptidoglycan-associated protein